MSTKTAIVLLGFNRPQHMGRLLSTLQDNREFRTIPVLAFVDGPRNREDEELISQVVKVVLSVRPDANITRQIENHGVAKSVTTAVTEALTEYEQVIVLEDDLELSSHFLRYMLDGLDAYRGEPKVASIHGYTIPMRGLPHATYFLRGTDCWGWGTWRESWGLYRDDSASLLNELINKSLETDFTFNHASPHLDLLKAAEIGQVDSWAIRWHASVFLAGGLTLNPSVSLVRNAGMDGSGRHSGTTNLYESTVSVSPIPVGDIPLAESEKAFRQYQRFYKNRIRRKRRAKAKRKLMLLAKSLVRKIRSQRS